MINLFFKNKVFTSIIIVFFLLYTNINKTNINYSSYNYFINTISKLTIYC